MKVLESKPKGSGEPAHTNQPETGLSHNEVATALATSGGPSADPSKQQIALLLTRREVAERWGCCSHTIARRKDLRPVRLGPRFLRYRLADVQAIEAAAAV